MIRHALVFLSVLVIGLALSAGCQHLSPGYSQAGLTPVDSDGFTDGAIFRYSELGFVPLRIGEKTLAGEARPAIVFRHRSGNHFVLIEGQLNRETRRELVRLLPKDGGWTLTGGSICPHPVYRPNEHYPAICIGFSVTGTSNEQWLAAVKYCDRLGIKTTDREFAGR